MPQTAKQSTNSRFSRFRTRKPNASTVVLDVGRAEFMFNMIELPGLGQGKKFDKFVGSVHAASNGDEAVLLLLLKAFRHWHKASNAFQAFVVHAWNGRRLSEQSAIQYLRRACTDQQRPMPQSMVHAIFDDASFDFVAYLAWHNR
jgi:hypothetical protein